MENKKFNIKNIYCSASNFNINSAYEIDWLKLKERKMSNQVSLSELQYKELDVSVDEKSKTYLAKFSASLKGTNESIVVYENFVTYTAIISLENYEDESLDMLMKINVAAFIFPYIRAELLRGLSEGKMPSVSLEPIDFVQFYHSNLVKK